MHEILNEINATAGVRGSMIVDKDGLVIISNLMLGLEERAISAMVASIYRDVELALGNLGQEKVAAVSLYASAGNIIFLCAPNCILTVITEKEVNLGLVSLKMKASLEKLGQII
ncbi:MAG: roadblock/LC7 domain-containing protein [Candidatus Edwardsbacteria bacterium]